jgi:hypothetical protein
LDGEERDGGKKLGTREDSVLGWKKETAKRQDKMGERARGTEIDIQMRWHRRGWF